MKIGLVDVDSHNFPNIALMKLSAWHKGKGDSVEWADQMTHYDRIYMSKVFTFTPDEYGFDADEIIKGGTGYGIETKLPDDVEHQYPDYGLYGISDTAYGYLTRGCPRNCPFCIVGKKEGLKSIKVADLCEFWNGQKFIKLLDPNLLACPDREDLLSQLVESGATVDYTQGLDIRFMTDKVLGLLNKTKYSGLHFAWDNPDDKVCERKLEQYASAFKKSRNGNVVYMLTNFGSTHEQDIYRVEKLRDLGYSPYVMIYEKETAPKITRDLQQWVNNRKRFNTRSFDEHRFGIKSLGDQSSRSLFSLEAV